MITTNPILKLIASHEGESTRRVQANDRFTKAMDRATQNDFRDAREGRVSAGKSQRTENTTKNEKDAERVQAVDEADEAKENDEITDAGQDFFNIFVSFFVKNQEEPIVHRNDDGIMEIQLASGRSIFLTEDVIGELEQRLGIKLAEEPKEFMDGMLDLVENQENIEKSSTSSDAKAGLAAVLQTPGEKQIIEGKNNRSNEFADSLTFSADDNQLNDTIQHQSVGEAETMNGLATKSAPSENNALAREILQEAEQKLQQEKDVAIEELNQPLAGKAAKQTDPVEHRDHSKMEDASEDVTEQPGAAKDKTISTQQPMTAAVAQDGKIDFKLGVQDLDPNQYVQLKEQIQTQIVDQVRSQVTQEKSEFFLQLKPEHLGGLSIMLTSEKDGIVAKMMTASKDVQAMIQSDMSQIQESLKSRGINVVQMEVVYDQMANMTNNQNTSSGQGLHAGQQDGARGHGGPSTEAEQIDEMPVSYNELSNYDILAEQGSSVEFSA